MVQSVVPYSPFSQYRTCGRWETGECIVKRFEQFVPNVVSRRSFLAGAGTAAAATVLAGCSSGSSPVGTSNADTRTTCRQLQHTSTPIT